MTQARLTKDVNVNVRTLYDPAQSDPRKHFYFFRYIITIENRSNRILQLLYRHWQITDSSGEYREVEGPGVIGQQPVLHPGDHFTYESGCNFTTDMGFMEGAYLVQDLETRENLMVDIPEFRMEVPWKAN